MFELENVKSVHLVHFKEKVKIKAPCCLEKLKAIGIVGIQINV